MLRIVCFVLVLGVVSALLAVTRVALIPSATKVARFNRWDLRKLELRY